MRNSNLIEHDGEVTVIDFLTEGMEDRSSAEQRAAELAEALKGGVEPFVTVHRLLGTGNVQEEFIARFPADKYDFGQLQETLANEHGGGEYRVRLYSSNKLVKGGNRLIRIANRKPSKGQEGEAAGILAVVLKQIESQQEKMMQILQRSINNNQNNDESEMKFLQKMMVMKQLFSSDSRASGGIETIRETMMFLKELGVDKEEQEDSGFTQLLEKMAPLVLGANQFNQVDQAQQNPRQNPSPRAQATRAQAMNMQQFQLKMGLGQLLTAAKKDADPGHWATTVLDMLPMEAVHGFVLAPNAIDQMIAIEGQVANYRDWFVLLGEHIKAQLNLPSTVSSEYDDEPESNGAEKGNGKSNV